MAKQEFIKHICSHQVTNRSELFSSVDIHEKITFISDPTSQEHYSKLRWQNLRMRFKILPYQSVKVLYLKDSSMPDKRVLSIDEMYDVLLCIHLDIYRTTSGGLACISGCHRSSMVSQPRKVSSLFVVKPISSTTFLSRCDVDLMDFRDMSEEHNMSESGISYFWLLVFQDHLTKFIRLRPLKNKCAVEVVDVIKDIFCELGIPHILQSDNGREFKNYILYSLINENRPNTKILHGMKRHPESQGYVERANCDLKNALASNMRDNSNDLYWVKYVRRVQLEKNTIGMTPFEAL